MKRLLSLLVVLAWSASAFAQTAATNPVTFAWDANPVAEHVIGYRLVTDQTIHDVGSATTFTDTFQAGTHIAAVLAYTADGTASKTSAPVAFVIAPQTTTDPACLPPLGAHAPAIFPTSATVTTGKPGSRSFLNYQLGGPDAVTEVAIQLDGADVVVGRGADVKAFSGMWFTQPAVGSHTVAVRVLTAFGCALVRQAAPLVVKP